MGDYTGIEWADATRNPLRGTRGSWACVKVSEGCANCYAERLNMRFGGPPYTMDADTLRLDEAALTLPSRWKRPRLVFVCSMTDLFAEEVPDAWIDKVFGVMAMAPQHTFQVLTKRATRMKDFLRARSFRPRLAIRIGFLMEPQLDDCPFLPNVWLGVSAENQARADERIPELLDTPAAVRWISAEPMLGPIDIGSYMPDKLQQFVDRGGPFLDWVVAGGESGGPEARAMVAQYGNGPKLYPKPWAVKALAAMRDECAAARVPFFFKQWGGRSAKAGGALLAGKEHREMPAGYSEGRGLKASG